jgi:cation diffusion facilitator CzcD-associated flavoprotein CzcO
MGSDPEKVSNVDLLIVGAGPSGYSLLPILSTAVPCLIIAAQNDGGDLGVPSRH